MGGVAEERDGGGAGPGGEGGGVRGNGEERGEGGGLLVEEWVQGGVEVGG